MKKWSILTFLLISNLSYAQTIASKSLIAKLKSDINIAELKLPELISKTEPLIKDKNPSPLAKQFGLDLLYCLYLKEDVNIQDAIQICQASGFFEYLEPNYIYQTDNILAPEQSLLKDFLLWSGIPNDPYYSSQWYLQKIQCPLAWDSVLGNPNFTVAVIDLGVNYLHEDLSATYAGGYDFQDYDTMPLPNAADPSGTMYAGIATAHTNNNLGIAGISWGSRYLAYRCGDNGLIYENKAISAVYDAVMKNASVIILGFGTATYSTSFNSAIQYAWQSGCVLIAHAGSYSYGQVRYPAGYDNVIAVTASNQNDYLVSGANYGNWIDVVAPGTNMFTTTINGYGLCQSTAAAIACVAGQVLLLKSKYPYLTNAQCVDKIFASCDSMPDPLYLEGMLGHGRINLFKMLTPLSDIKENLRNNTYPKLTISPNPFSSQTSIQFYLPKTSQLAVEIYSINGRLIKTFSTHHLVKINDYLIWNAKDNHNQKVPYGIYFIKLKTNNNQIIKKLIYTK